MAKTRRRAWRRLDGEHGEELSDLLQRVAQDRPDIAERVRRGLNLR